MGAQGEATIDFGTKNIEATIAVTGQASILAASYAEAFRMIASTANHSEDEHLVEEIEYICGIPTAGVGFTIYGRVRNGTTSGQWKVKWVWN